MFFFLALKDIKGHDSCARAHITINTRPEQTKLETLLHLPRSKTSSLDPELILHFGFIMSSEKSYSDLVDLVLQIPALADAVTEMSQSKRTLNLVTPDWQTELTNSLWYQELEAKSASLFRSLKQKSEVFQVQHLKAQTGIKIMVLVHGFYLLDKKNDKPTIRVLASEPLERFCKIMTSDINDRDFKISNEFRFYMDLCNPLTCHTCNSSRQFFATKGCQVAVRGNPCILDTKIFDGQHVLNRFVSQTKDSILRDFIGIAKIEINSRYFYHIKDDEGNMVEYARMGGNIKELLAFTESRLKRDNTPKVVLGDFDFIGEVEPSKTNDPQPSTSEKKEDENDFMRSNELMEEDEETLSFKRSLDTMESDNDESLIEALPSHFKRTRVEGEENCRNVTVEETDLILD